MNFASVWKDAWSKSNRRVLIFLSLTFVVFTCVYPYLGQVNNPNENVRTYMTMAIVEHHTFRIDEMVRRHGWTNDMARAPDKKTGQSHLYSVKAPAVSYLGVPFYWFFWKIAPIFGHLVPDVGSTTDEKTWWLRGATFTVRLFGVQLVCFGFLVAFERWLRGVSSDATLRLSAVAAAGLGTNYLAYSLMFVSHALFAVAAFASFAVTTSAHRFGPRFSRKPLAAFLAGFFAGLATLLEYHALPVSFVLALYALSVFWRPRPFFWLALGGGIDVLALMFFQWRAFGDPFTPGHRMSENQAYAHLLNQGLFGIGKPSWDVMENISLSRAYGFFGTSPFMWLGLLVVPFGFIWVRGGRRGRRRSRLTTSAWLCAMAALWLTVGAAINWRGGWTVGPRYLGAAPPFFAFGAVSALESVARRSPLRRTIVRGLAGGLALASVIQTGIVSLVYNSLPESVTRPLPQFALALIRTGFVPHHAAEIVGWSSPTFWYVVLACLCLAPLVATVAWRSETPSLVAVHVGLVAVFAALALVPAFGAPSPEEGGDNGLSARRDLTAIWEPKGRDFVAQLRLQAERFGPRVPCAWYKLADKERIIDWQSQALRDEKSARAPRTECP